MTERTGLGPARCKCGHAKRQHNRQGCTVAVGPARTVNGGTVADACPCWAFEAAA